MLYIIIIYIIIGEQEQWLLRQTLYKDNSGVTLMAHQPLARPWHSGQAGDHRLTTAGGLQVDG